jgi:hypothetical protein
MIQIDDVFALSLTDEEKYESDASEHPAESGADFVDNKVNKALAITRDCIISGTPIGPNLNSAHGPDIVEGCRKRLIAIDASREPITVRDSTGVYENMEITSLVFSRSIKTGNALTFKIAFKRLVVITNERSVIQVAIPRAQVKAPKGLKTSAKPDPKPAERDIDPLRRVSNYLGVTGN